MKRVAALAIAVSALPVALGADINKCQSPSGRTIYSDAPCPSDAKSAHVTPPPPVSETDQSMAELRNAAAQARVKSAVRRADQEAADDLSGWRARRAEEARQAQREAEAARRRQELQDLADRIAAQRPIYTPRRLHTPPRGPSAPR